MARHRVDVQVHSPFKGQVSPLWLRRVARGALEVALGAAKEGPSIDRGRGCQLGLVIADDEAVHRLNREYRGEDEVTDVLAFPLLEGEPFPLSPGEPQPLGEVIVSFPQAVRQARDAGQPVERELALLIVHGVLHLLGYDHAEPRQEEAMKALEREALSRLF